jgi:hypothetical protein
VHYPAIVGFILNANRFEEVRLLYAEETSRG